VGQLVLVSIGGGAILINEPQITAGIAILAPRLGNHSSTESPLPSEDGYVTISRSTGKVTLPCHFMLVAAMPPCPCGYLGEPKHECRCAPTQIQRYRAHISGPLLDRIDLHVEAPALSIAELRDFEPGEGSAVFRLRVEKLAPCNAPASTVPPSRPTRA
jgi:hypothetical protein